MIVGLLLRHYKNYDRVRFIPLLNDTENMFSVYIGNNGVGKSAILEALDLVMNGRRTWNITQGQKRSEAYVCPVFLISKDIVKSPNRPDFEKISSFFWSVKTEDSPSRYNTPEIKAFFDFKNKLIKYEETHYLILIGKSNDYSGGYFASPFDASVKSIIGDSEEERIKHANSILDDILSMYSYLYIPVEASPTDLLQLRNETMQKLLNKDIQQEIENILTTKNDNVSIVNQINKNLESFMNEVNTIISGIDPEYSFASESGYKQNLTAKDIRAKIIEAYFPLKALRKGTRRVELLSSGEQRRAVIDIAYSTLLANKESKTQNNIILAIDEPETSMHISNCYSQFSRLEELSVKGVQVIITTHWYGYLPIAQNGMMHYLETKENQTNISSFNMFNLLESKRSYPDDVELKSMFDLASSLISYMRREAQYKWLFVEGSSDKLYLKTILSKHKNIRIIPLGGCGNVVKLYNIILGFMAEQTEVATSSMLFLIDTDTKQLPIKSLFHNRVDVPVRIRRLQVNIDEISLVDPSSEGAIYNKTLIEDCLNPELYYKAIEKTISLIGDESIKTVFDKFSFIKDAKTSMLRGDSACIQANDTHYISKKQSIIDFAESRTNKTYIAQNYVNACEGKSVYHQLEKLIIDCFEMKGTKTKKQ